MKFRKVFILVAAYLTFAIPSFSQKLTDHQVALSRGIYSFLQKEGFEPENTDEAIIFTYEDCKYVVQIIPEEESPMFVTLSAAFELPEGYSMRKVIFASNVLSAFKGVKLICKDTVFYIQADVFLLDVQSFSLVFYPMLRQIHAVIQNFLDAYNRADGGDLSDVIPSFPQKQESMIQMDANKPKKAPEGVYYNPKVTGQLTKGTSIKAVMLTEQYTCIVLSSNSVENGSVHEWCRIDANTYILNDDKPYEKLKLTRAEGIAIAPDKTYYGGRDKTITFKLFFPPLPKDTKTISLIEPDSSWCFYEIILRK